MSRIAKKKITVPKSVKIALSDRELELKGVKAVRKLIAVQGPKGEATFVLPKEHETFKVDGLDSGEVSVSIDWTGDDQREQSELLGLYTRLLGNMVVGVSQGYEKILEIQGVGYKAATEGSNTLVLSLGFSHPVKMEVPKGVTLKLATPTLISLSGVDKCLVGEFAAKVRAKKPPEPYKGKGIRYKNEVVRQKAGKKVAK